MLLASNTRPVLFVEHAASAVSFAFWLILPFRERNNFIRFNVKNMSLYRIYKFS